MATTNAQSDGTSATFAQAYRAMRSDFALAVGLSIKLARLVRGFSMQRLADLALTSRVRLSAWENGRGMPDAMSLDLLRSTLNVPAGFLLGSEQFVDQRWYYDAIGVDIEYGDPSEPERLWKIVDAADLEERIKFASQKESNPDQQRWYLETRAWMLRKTAAKREMEILSWLHIRPFPQRHDEFEKRIREGFEYKSQSDFFRALGIPLTIDPGEQPRPVE